MYTDIIARALAAKALSEGGGGGGGNANIEYHTTQYFEEHHTTVYAEGTIIVFSDYKKDEQEQDVPGIKIADGVTRVLDLPFINQDADIQELEERVDEVESDVETLNTKSTTWDNKVNIEDNIQDETLVFTRN